MRKKILLNLMILLSIIGLFTSFYLVKTHYDTSDTFCDFNEVLACSVVNSSQFSEIFNVPVAVFGMLWFIFFIGMIWQIKKRTEYPILALVIWSTIGLFSVIYFIIAEIIIGAICIFCTIVHVVIIILLIISFSLYFSQKPMKKLSWKIIKKWFITLVIISLFFIIVFNLTEDRAELAQCISEKGMVFYSSEFCSHCKQQKDLFGNSLKYITEIECSPHAKNSQTDLCTENNITGTPTWVLEVEGKEIKRNVGYMSIEELKEFTGC